MPASQRPTALLIETDPGLGELEEDILTDAGLRVVALPPNTDPVGFAAHLRPTVVVAHVGLAERHGLDLVDRFRTDPTTEAMPVVTVAMAEETAAAAKAASNVRAVVVAPYNISALGDAVAQAIGHPPPPAVLPQTPQPVPTPVAFAAKELSVHARAIVLQTVRALQRDEPYRWRFPALSLGLVDDLGTMVGAIAHGLLRGLTPAEVFAIPAINASIDAHVRLRESQGLGVAAAIHEDRGLKVQVDQFLQSLVGQSGFTRADAADVSRQVQAFTDQLARIIAAKYRPGGP